MSRTKDQRLPNCETAVCSRLATVRRVSKISQTEFAGTIGVTRDQLANVEVFRSPLRFWPGWRACRTLNVSQLWLSSGDGPQKPFLDLNISHFLTNEFADDRLLFRLMCATALFFPLIAIEEEIHHGSSTRLLHGPELERLKLLSRNLHEQAGVLLRSAQQIDVDILFSEIQRANLKKSGLTQSDACVTLGAVRSNPEMESLIVRIRRFTNNPDKRSELVKFLGVPRESVSRWLSGAREPGGETTLQLLNWVEQQERKSK
jgi:DNA-binding transcriptional regulator YiaG